MNTNQNWTINAPAGATYLSDFLTEIPANCLFNKKQTGCGATELAIRNSIPTIIAMPYVALVKNKTIYRKDDISVLGVYEGIQEQDIIDYAKSHSPLKIAVTYDSLPRTIRALESAGFNPYKDLFLLVDEWHVLFNSYSFRHTAIKNLLAEAAKFDRATYMTATPIEQEYVLEELKHPACLRNQLTASNWGQHPFPSDLQTCPLYRQRVPQGVRQPIGTQPAYLRQQRGVYRKGNRPCETHSRQG